MLHKVNLREELRNYREVMAVKGLETTANKNVSRTFVNDIVC